MNERPDIPDDMTVEDLGFLHWWGPPTLYRCPLESDAARVDVALVGVPHSTGNGATWRDQHLGPRSIRDVSMAYRRLHLGWRFDPWNACRIRDMGDVPILNTLANDVAVREIERFYTPIDAAGVRPVSFGGDHSISLAILRAIAGPDSPHGRPAAVVHFDAHYDTYDDFPNWYGAYDSAGHWASKSVHEHHVDATRSVQIGIRGHDVWMDPGKTSRELGYRIVTKDEFDDELGIEGTVGPHPRARRRPARLRVVRPRRARHDDRARGLEPRAGGGGPHDEGGDPGPAGHARDGRDRRRRGRADAERGFPELDDRAERDPYRLRVDLPDRRPGRDAGRLVSPYGSAVRLPARCVTRMYVLTRNTHAGKTRITQSACDTMNSSTRATT